MLEVGAALPQLFSTVHVCISVSALARYCWCVQVGGTYARPMLLPPEVAIGAFGRIRVSPAHTHML